MEFHWCLSWVLPSLHMLNLDKKPETIGHQILKNIEKKLDRFSSYPPSPPGDGGGWLAILRYLSEFLRYLDFRPKAGIFLELCSWNSSKNTIFIKKNGVWNAYFGKIFSPAASWFMKLLLILIHHDPLDPLAMIWPENECAEGEKRCRLSLDYEFSWDWRCITWLVAFNSQGMRSSPLAHFWTLDWLEPGEIWKS